MLNNNNYFMSLENYYPSTDERKRRDVGERIEYTDKSIKEVKEVFSCFH